MSVSFQTYLKKGLLGIIILVLSLGILQDLFQYKQVAPLHGYFPTPQDTVFTFKNWLTGRFQAKREDYLGRNFSLRADLIRTHNSLVFSLFHKTDIKWVVFGNQHHLMDKQQVTSYLGADTLSYETIRKKTRYIKMVSDTLARLGKSFYVLVPPTKPSVYPEYIPAGFGTKNTRNNYERFTEEFDKNNIAYIDFVALFRQLKKDGVQSLFPHNGSHWNEHGATLALQYFIKEISRTQKKDFPLLSIEKLPWEKEHNSDLDILTTMNLFRKSTSDTAVYPVIKVSGKRPPSCRTLFISDSFFDFWIEKGIYEVLDSVSYFFYNDRVIGQDHVPTDITYTAQDMLLHFDYIMVLCNESNLDEIGWGGIEKLYFYFYPNDPNRIYDDKVYRRKVLDKMKFIQRNEKWFGLVQEKALKHKISFNKQLYLDAVWELEQENTASGN